MNSINLIDGGITTPKGFLASGLHCGLRKNQDKKDLSLVYTKNIANAAAVYTQNLVKGAPCIVTKNNLENGFAKAIICNSGIANTCAFDGIEKANEMAELVGSYLNIDKTDVVVASTGVIGPSINMEPISNAMGKLTETLSADGGTDAAEAIMTTDTFAKQRAVTFMINEKLCHIGGMAKGSGMIAPNMATLLSFLTSDVKIDTPILEKALTKVVNKTFNMLSIDGDTSTNDMLVILANGDSNCENINTENESYNIFLKALEVLCVALVKDLATDGEGATKLIECKVFGGKTLEDTSKSAKAVINSSLLKAAIFGSDPNWGRILCAVGYSGADVDISKVNISFASKTKEVYVCKNGSEIIFDEKAAKEILNGKEIIINVYLNDGTFESTAWGCDLTYDYVKINGSYRT